VERGTLGVHGRGAGAVAEKIVSLCFPDQLRAKTLVRKIAGGSMRATPFEQSVHSRKGGAGDGRAASQNIVGARNFVEPVIAGNRIECQA
jgi:hypothetical protein